MMIFRILVFTLTGFAIGAVMMGLGSRGLPSAAVRGRWVKFAVYFAIVHGFLAAAAAGRPWLQLLVVFILAAGAVELYRAARLMRSGTALFWLVYIVAGLLLLRNVWLLPAASVAYLYLLIAVYDGFSQVTGQLFGRHPLAPRISPGKSVEGLLGGLAGVLIVSVVLRSLAGLAVPASLAVGTATAIAGLGGDLAASWVKRLSGIKDYSNALPGHGGFLDRFDSFILAGALVGGGLLALA